MAQQKRKDNKGRILRTGEYYNSKTHVYQFRKMIDGQRVTITDYDLAELRKRENELLVDLDKGKNTKNRNKNMTLNEYFEFWLSTYAPNKVKASTLSRYKEYYDNYINDSLGSRKISKLTKVDFQILFNEMIAKGLGHSTLNITRSVLNNVFECAIDDDIVFKNPVRNIDIGSKDTKEKDAVSKEQLDIFMNYVKESKYAPDYPLFVTLFNTGIRISELAALTWNDIDFANDSININKSYVKVNNKLYGFSEAIGTPKSKKSNRVVYMNKATRTALLHHRMSSLNNIDCKLPIINDRGDVIGECSDFVFLSMNDRVVSEGTARLKIKSIVDSYNKTVSDKGVKLDYFSPHCTRHTFTSLAYESGADMKMVSESLGHSSTSITFDIYTHLSEKKQNEKKEIFKSISVG